MNYYTTYKEKSQYYPEQTKIEDLHPYSNYEKNKKELDKQQLEYERDIVKSMLEYERVRQSILGAIVDYTRNQMLDDTYTNAFFDAATASIQPPLGSVTNDKIIEDHLKKIFPAITEDEITYLTDDEKKYAQDTDDYKSVLDLAAAGQIPKKNALFLASVVKNWLDDVFQDNELSRLKNSLSDIDIDFDVLISKDNLTELDKKEIKQKLLGRHAEIYESWNGTPTPSVTKKYEQGRAKYEKELEALQFTDYDRAEEIASDLFFPHLEKYAIQLADATMKKYYAKKRRGRPPVQEKQVRDELGKIIKSLPDTYYKNIIESKYRQYK